MCGLVGYSGKTPVNPYKFKILMLYARERGTDGAGVGYRKIDTKDKKEKFFYVKELGDPSNMVSNLTVPEVDTIIGHTRNSSTYTGKTVKALHPHFSGKYFGTHNGYLYNYHTVARELKYDNTSDSITFFEALAKNKGDFSKTTELFTGSGAFAYIDTEFNLHLAVVKDRPLHYGYGDDGIWYASVKEYLYGIGIKETIQINEGEHLIFNKGELISTIKNNKFKHTVYDNYSNYGSYAGRSNHIGFKNTEPTIQRTYNINDFVKGKHAPNDADILVDKNGKISYYWQKDCVITVETLGIYSTSVINSYDLTREIDVKELSRHHNEIYQLTINSLIK